MMRYLCAAFMLLIACQAIQKDNDRLTSLQVSESGRFLVKENGDPFFWLGDTGWRLFSNLTREESVRYLEDRKAKGFTVIQCQLLPVNPDLENAYGHRPFHERDVRQPIEEYWDHVAYVLEKAGETGLYMAVLPAWARTYIEDRLGNPEYKLFTNDPQGAYDYGYYLGRRFMDMDHLIWVLGGDSWGTKDSIYNRMAQGITDGYRDGDGDRVLMSYHPKGGTYRPPATSSGEFYHDMEWMDFNMIQSGHRIGNRNFEKITEDYNRLPVKPTLESEPCYEHHPVRHDFKNGEFSAWHLRRRAYWAILAGSFGFTYGGNGIWQMSTPERPGRESHFNYYWYQALDHEGGKQMVHVRNLFESRPYIDPQRMPDQGIIFSQQDTVDGHVQCARAGDYSYWIIYVTNGRALGLRTGFLKRREYRAWWYDPRTGLTFNPDSAVITKPFEFNAVDDPCIFDPPGSPGPGNDWVLVLDDVNAGYGIPGKRTR